MGLRINTNISSIRALRTLDINERNQSRSLERLATGLRINRGSDDPSGLIISELLRAQLASLDQAVRNSQNASNLISIADAALKEASDLLVNIQDSIVFAQNTGGASPDQIAAEQDSVDQAIAAIDRIANTTRYADRELLNGSAEFQVTRSTPDFFDNLVVRSVNFAGNSFERQLSITPSINAQRASILIDTASSTSGGTVRITGPRGTADVVLSSGSGADVIAAAINTFSGFTGVYASGAAGGNLYLRTEDFGTSQLVKLEAVASTTINGQVQGVISSVGGTQQFQVLNDNGARGTFTDFAVVASSSVGTFLTPGELVSDRGRDGVILFEGQAFTGVGNEFSILSPSAQFQFKIDPDMITTDVLPAAGAQGPDLVSGGLAQSLTLANTGLNFQLNEAPLPTDDFAVGINSINTNRLGLDPYRNRISEAENGFASQILAGGYLNTIRTGAGNDLAQNPENASVITREAINQVASVRGYLGAVQADAMEPNIDSLGVAIENLSASLSELRDLDFAEETSNFTRTQILFQSGIAVLASANLIPQSVLTLLS